MRERTTVALADLLRRPRNCQMVRRGLRWPPTDVRTCRVAGVGGHLLDEFVGDRRR